MMEVRSFGRCIDAHRSGELTDIAVSGIRGHPHSDVRGHLVTGQAGNREALLTSQAKAFCRDASQELERHDAPALIGPVQHTARNALSLDDLVSLLERDAVEVCFSGSGNVAMHLYRHVVVGKLKAAEMVQFGTDVVG